MQSLAARGVWFSCKVNRWRTQRSLQHFSGISLLVSTSSAETDKNIVTSKHHFLFTATRCTLEHTASWSRHYGGLQTPALNFPGSLLSAFQRDSWSCFAHFCCRALASLSPGGNTVRSHRCNGEGIPSSQGLPQLVKLLKETLNGGVCQEIIISLSHTSFNSLLITGNPY